MKRPIEAVIEDVISEPSKIQPIIVNFQNGQLKDEGAKKISCGIFFDQEKKKTALALSNDQIVYKGYKPNISNDLTRTMLVVHNKKTGTCKLVEVERWQVSPVLQTQIAEDNSDTADSRIAQLNKQFGSKKAKRRTEQYEKLQINVESVKDRLEQTVANMEIDKEDLSTQAPNNEYLTDSSLPKINRNATNVKDVYNIYDIVPKDKLQTLHEAAKEILENDKEGKSKFFTSMLKYMKSNPENNVKKVALLLYIEATAAWLNMPLKDAKKRGVEVCPYSQEINEYVINTYSTASAHGRARPNTMKDKGIIDCMILALVASNYMLDLEIFSTIFSTRTGMKKLMELARIIAATPSKEDKKVICLKLPLPAPLSIFKKDKKK